jgi:hypothetical protein
MKRGTLPTLVVLAAISLALGQSSPTQPKAGPEHAKLAVQVGQRSGDCVLRVISARVYALDKESEQIYRAKDYGESIQLAESAEGSADGWIMIPHVGLSHRYAVTMEIENTIDGPTVLNLDLAAVRLVLSGGKTVEPDAMQIGDGIARTFVQMGESDRWSLAQLQNGRVTRRSRIRGSDAPELTITQALHKGKEESCTVSLSGRGKRKFTILFAVPPETLATGLQWPGLSAFQLASAMAK